MIIYIIGLLCEMFIGSCITAYFFVYDKQPYFSIISAIFTIIICLITYKTFFG